MTVSVTSTSRTVTYTPIETGQVSTFTPVVEDGYRAGLLKIGELPDGNLVAAWTVTGATGSVRAQILNADGTPVGAEFRLAATDMPRDIEVLGDGSFLLLYVDTTGITLERVASDGSALSGPVRVHSSDFLQGVDLHLLEDGTSMLTWLSKELSVVDTRPDLVGLRLDETGATVGNVFEIQGSFSSTDQTVRSEAQVARLENGTYVVTWTAKFGTGDEKAMMRAFNADGTPLTGQFEVAAYSGYDYSIQELQAVGNQIVVITDRTKYQTLGQQELQVFEITEVTDFLGTYSTFQAVGNQSIGFSYKATDNARVLALEDGGYAISSYESGGNFTRNGTYLTFKDANGLASSGSLLVEGLYSGSFVQRMSELDDGSIAITWTKGLAVETRVFAPPNSASTGELAISGDLREDATITADLGTILDLDGIDQSSIVWTWTAGRTEVDQGPSASYTLDQVDVARKVGLSVTYKDSFGYEETLSIGTLDRVENVNDAPVGDVVITGDARLGGTLELGRRFTDDDGYFGADLQPTPQWYRDGVAIEGATGLTYVVTEADRDSDISVDLTYTDYGGTTETVAGLPVSYGTVTTAGAGGHFTVDGSGGSDRITTFAGNDLVEGAGGDDVIAGGDGDDTLYGSFAPKRANTTAETTLADGKPLALSLNTPRTDGAGEVEISGYIGREVFTVAEVDIVFAVDISDSTRNVFVGSVAVQDINGDFVSNSVLDAELLAFDSLLTSVIDDAELGDASVLLLPFNTVVTGRQEMIADTDANGNGTADLIEYSRNLDASGGTNFSNPLRAAYSHFNTSTAGQKVLYFLSDGEADTSTLGTTIQQLKDLGVKTKTFAVGSAADARAMDFIDDGLLNGSASVVTDPSTLSATILDNGIDASDIASVAVLVNGRVVSNHDASFLKETPFGLRYDLTVKGLDPAADDTVKLVVTASDGSATELDVGSVISDPGPPDKDVIDGGKGNDKLFGGFGDDSLDGGEGDDRLDGGLGDDILNGGAGIDTVVIDALSTGASVIEENGRIILTSSDGRDTLTGIEFVEFRDTRVALADLIPPPEPQTPQEYFADIPDFAVWDATQVPETYVPDLPLTFEAPTVYFDPFDTTNSGRWSYAPDLSTPTGATAEIPGSGDDGLIGALETVKKPLASILQDFVKSAAAGLGYSAQSGLVDSMQTSQKIYDMLDAQVDDLGKLYDQVLTGDADQVEKTVKTLLKRPVEFFAGEFKFIGSFLKKEVSMSGSFSDMKLAVHHLNPSDFAEHRDIWVGSSRSESLSFGSKTDLGAGGGGADRLSGQKGNDILLGGSGGDTLLGGGGKDYLVGESGKDALRGGSGNDGLHGGGGRDRLRGDGGQDKLAGGAGADKLMGGGGRDELAGGSGKDFLDGGRGDDVLKGGSKADVFFFKKGSGKDTITDFRSGVDTVEIGKGAKRFGQLTFEEAGADVVMTFRNVEVTFQDTLLEEVANRDYFVF